MRPPLVVLLSLAPASLGCAGTVSGGADGVDAEATTTTSALISIEKTSDAVGSRAEANARFLRVLGSASPGVALQAIGAALDLPAAGACVALASRGELGAAAPLPVVELVDVGGVSIEASGVETRLVPRQLPDVTDVVSGIVYARATDPALISNGAPYLVRVAGGASVDGFAITTTSAGDPGDVRVEGEDDIGTVLATAPSVELSWPPNADVVYVDVRPVGVRCSLGDSGRGSVSSVLLDDTGTLVVHRLKREAVRSHGIDSGEVRFDFARTVAYVRR